MLVASLMMMLAFARSRSYPASHRRRKTVISVKKCDAADTLRICVAQNFRNLLFWNAFGEALRHSDAGNR
jgi:hypothetical protein